MLSFYPREVAFYTQLAQHSPIRTPRLLHAELDIGDHSFVLLLEDMGGATLGDQIAGLTPAQAEAAITAIGRLHGAWWGKVDSGGMDALFDFANPQYGAAVQAGYQGFLAPALSGFADCYSDYTKKTAEGLAPVAARVIKDLCRQARAPSCMATIAPTTCCSRRVSATTASPPSTGRFPAAAARCTTSPT